MNNKKYKKGYTIIESLGVLSMIGIMASVSIPSYLSVKKAAQFTKAEAEVKVLQTIVERYKTINQRLPEGLDLSTFNTNINITGQTINDPFKENCSYELETGKTVAGKEYYIIYSSGDNRKKDFYLHQDQIYLQGDDIIASNLPIISH